MQMAKGTIMLALIAVLAVSACGRRKDPQLMNIRSNTAGPDEFTILPGKPLEAPDFAVALPAPTPGGANLTDPTPKADAVAALGGDPSRVAASGKATIGRGDGSIVNHARRFGASGNIRQQLATEDLEFRRNNRGRVLERLFNVNMYFRAYRHQSLNQYNELQRFRRLGVRTPSAPPDPASLE